MNSGSSKKREKIIKRAKIKNILPFLVQKRCNFIFSCGGTKTENASVALKEKNHDTIPSNKTKKITIIFIIAFTYKIKVAQKERLLKLNTLYKIPVVPFLVFY